MKRNFPASPAALALAFAALAGAWLVVSGLWFPQREPFNWYVLAADAAFVACFTAVLYVALRARDKARREIEERFRLVTETYADWYWEVDADLRFTYATGGGLARIGIEPHQMIGRATSEIAEFSLLDMPPAQFARLRNERRTYRDVRASLNMPDGKVRYLSLTGEPVFAANGEFRGYRGVTREITAEVEAERALKASEGRFRRIVESAPELLFFMTNLQRDRWDYVGPNLKAIWNFDGDVHDPASVARQFDRIHPEDRPKFDGRAAAEARGERVDIEYRVREPDGSIRWMHTRTTGVPAEDGEVEVFGITEDVTERHRVLEQVSASDALQRSILDNMGDGVVVRDASGAITSVNRAAERILGISAEKMIENVDFGPGAATQREDGSALPAEDLPWRRVFLSGRPVRGEVLSVHRGYGVRVWLRVNATPLRLSDGMLRGVVITFQDITVERAAVENLEKLAATLERRVVERTTELVKTNRELEAFAHSVSHDLRTPLRAINGFARLLAEREGARLDNESRRLLARIEAGAGRMGELIDDVIAYSAATRREPEFETVDLDALAESVLARLTRAYPATRLELGPLGNVVGDAKMLESVLEQLFGNALKFSASAEEPLVRVWATDYSGGRTIHIADNGAGFDQAHAGQLFSLFRRLHHEHEFPGTGVGLAIVKNLIEKQGGAVAGNGEPGRGATFAFSLGTPAV